MSDLQAALIVLGIFVIAGVVVYNWVQERKLRKEVTSEFIVPQKDVLADDFHIDVDAYIVDKELAEVTEKFKQSEHHSTQNIDAPTIKEPTSQNQYENDSDTDAKLDLPESKANPALAAQVNADLVEVESAEAESIIKAVLHEQVQRIHANLPDVVHSQIDLTAILFPNKNIKNSDLSAFSHALVGIDLPIMMHGLDKHDKWQVVSESQAETTFKQVACSLQLADRGGPVAKNLLNKFQFAVEDAGLALNAHVEWQGSGDAMQRAIELDQFCIEVDQMISVHIAQGETPIHGTKLKGLAEANGMVLNADGKFHFYANEAHLFSALDTNNTPFTAENLRSNVLKSVTFQIEIPKVSNCEQVFNQMIGIAQKMTSSLNASLVDDNQKQLGDLQIEKIRQQLKVIHATMVARGIMPGSPSSMRLFN